MQKSGTWYYITMTTNCSTKEKTVNHGNVVSLLSQKWFEQNAELFFIKVWYSGLREMIESLYNCGLSLWFSVSLICGYLLANSCIANGKPLVALQKPCKHCSEQGQWNWGQGAIALHSFRFVNWEDQPATVLTQEYQHTIPLIYI